MTPLGVFLAGKETPKGVTLTVATVPDARTNPVMKILRIIARLNVGGPARHVVWLTKETQDNEFNSTLIAGRVPDGEEDMSYLAELHGVKPVFIEEMSRELSIKTGFTPCSSAR